VGLRPRIADAELDAAFAGLLLSANEHAEPGRVDELDPAEVDNDR
jgi:hypothetical protein